MESNSKHINRVTNELGLAAAALLGAAHNVEFSEERRDDIMAQLDNLFGWTVVESDRARDHMFWDATDTQVKEQAHALAHKLIRLASEYNGSDEHDSMIFMAGYDMFDMCDSLFDHCLDLAGKRELKPDGSFGEREPLHDYVYDGGSASLVYWGRV